MAQRGKAVSSSSGRPAAAPPQSPLAFVPGILQALESGWGSGGGMQGLDRCPELFSKPAVT